MEYMVRFGPRGNTLMIMTIKDGKFYKAYENVDHFNHGTSSTSEHYSGEEKSFWFESMVETFIRELFNYNREQYEKMLEELDEETKNKYFKISYIPK